MLIDLIKAHALTEAQAGDWAAVAATLQAVTITAAPRLCYAVESGTAVAQAGGDPTAMLTVLLADPNGMMLFQKLSSSAGVMWSHPATIPYLEALVSAGAMSEAVKDALIDLSAPVTHPHADVTADYCQRAWIITECIEPITQAHSAAVAKLNNAQASLGPEHTDGLTLEQLQTRCDAITSSETGEI